MMAIKLRFTITFQSLPSISWSLKAQNEENLHYYSEKLAYVQFLLYLCTIF